MPFSSSNSPSRITLLRSTPRMVMSGGGDVDGLLVDALVDQDQVAGLGGVDRRLDGVVVLRAPGWRRARVPPAAAAPASVAAGAVAPVAAAADGHGGEGDEGALLAPMQAPGPSAHRVPPRLATGVAEERSCILPHACP